MKRFLSYIHPITKYVDSRINGKLEITWINGKKNLDSKNTNYSYGSLQRILNYGLSQINFSSITEILILGLGGGCVIKSLRDEFDYMGKITAIEIDETVIDIAQKEFNIFNKKNLKIICDDANSYIKNCQNQYDLIIIDLFIDTVVPSEFFSIEFWQMLIPLLEQEGNIIFNVGIDIEEDIRMKKIMEEFSHLLEFSEHKKVEGTNYMIIAKKNIAV